MDIFYEIKSRVKMKDLLESYSIRPFRGTNIYRCVFHNDKHPSARITPDTDRFHCFVCNKAWDIFDFVQEYENCDIKTAIQILDARFDLGLLRELSHKQKLEIARQRRERELLKKQEEREKRLEKALCDYLLEEIEKNNELKAIGHLTRRDYKNGEFPFDAIFFTAVKRELWLNWLYDVFSGAKRNNLVSFDFIYGNDKKILLNMIKNGDIEI